MDNRKLHQPRNRDIAAVPWYTSEECYESFRATASDPDEFFESHAQWLSIALEHERQAKLRGVPIIRVRMNINDFHQWLIEMGKSNTSDHRSDYAEQLAHRLLDWKST